MILQCSGHPLILDTMGLWKATDCPFEPQKSPLWSQCFCLNNPTFMLHLQTKVLPSFLTSSHLSWPISHQNFVLFRMVTKKNLQFSLISFFFLSLLMPLWWHAELRTLLSALPSSLWLSSCHPSPPSCVPSSLCYLVYDLNESVLFRKKRSLFRLIHFQCSLYYLLFHSFYKRHC